MWIRWGDRSEFSAAARHRDAPLQAFTDGASSPDGRGGWAYVVVHDDTEILRGQGSALPVTYQRMEIRAVAEALARRPEGRPRPDGR